MLLLVNIWDKREDWVPLGSSTKLSCAQGLPLSGLQFRMAMEFSCCAGWEVADKF